MSFRERLNDPWRRRQDWIWPSSIALTSAAPVAAPFVPVAFPNPTPALAARVDWIWGTPDTLTNPPGLTPFYLLDWPVPKGAPYPEFRGIPSGSFPPFIVQPPDPFSLRDWPNPGIAARGIGVPESTNPNLYPPAPPPPPVATDSSTPGRTVRDSYEEWERRQRRDGPDAPYAPVRTNDGPDRLREYTDKADKLNAAIAKVRGETAALQAEAQAIQERITALAKQDKAAAAAKAERALLLKQQALQLAQAQEAMLLQELEMLDVAYVAVMAYMIAAGLAPIN